MTTARHARRLTALAAAALAAGCGGDGYNDGDGSFVDAGPDLDGPAQDASADAPGCGVTVEFVPAAPLAGAEVTAKGHIEGSSGFVVWEWGVHRGADEVPYTRLGEGQDILFRVPDAGIYDIQLSAGGTGCAPWFGSLNVTAPGANTEFVRLRVVPPVSVGAPPQERTLLIMGGGDQGEQNVTLDPGLPLPITVRTPAAAPVAAYLRFTSSASPDVVIEGFSDAGGNAAVRMVPGRYDVLIVPTSSALAPRVIPDWDPLTGALTVDAGQALGGIVLDAGGDPLAGARVSVMSGGVPSTIGTTGADGRFALRWREGGVAETVTVVAPDGSDLPRLDATFEVGALAELTVQHANVPRADVGGTLVRVGGAPAASTDVLVALTRPACGEMRDGAGVLATAAGSHRRTLRTDATGFLPAARFVEGTGAAFIASAGPGARATFPVPAAAAVDAAAPVEVVGQVLRAAGGARAGARVRATMTGVLAHTGAPAPAVTTGGDGRFAIALAAGAAYELVITDPSGDDAARTFAIAAAAATDLETVALPAALAVRGKIFVSGSSVGVRGVSVAALCQTDCDGIERTRPLGEAVSDELGRFVVAVPDPGVTP